MRQQNSVLKVYLNDKNDASNTIVRCVSQGNTFTENVKIGILADNKKWNMAFRLEYESGFMITTSASNEFSKYFVQLRLVHS